MEIDETELLKWLTAGISEQEAVLWKRCGVHDADEAKKWREKGYSFRNLQKLTSESVGYGESSKQNCDLISTVLLTFRFEDSERRKPLESWIRQIDALPIADPPEALVEHLDDQAISDYEKSYEKDLSDYEKALSDVEKEVPDARNRQLKRRLERQLKKVLSSSPEVTTYWDWLPYRRASIGWFFGTVVIPNLHPPDVLALAGERLVVDLKVVPTGYGLGDLRLEFDGSKLKNISNIGDYGPVRPPGLDARYAGPSCIDWDSINQIETKKLSKSITRISQADQPTYVVDSVHNLATDRSTLEEQWEILNPPIASYVDQSMLGPDITLHMDRENSHKIFLSQGDRDGPIREVKPEAIPSSYDEAHELLLGKPALRQSAQQKDQVPTRDGSESPFKEMDMSGLLPDELIQNRSFVSDGVNWRVGYDSTDAVHRFRNPSLNSPQVTLWLGMQLPGEEAHEKFPTGPLSYSESLERTLARIRAFNPTRFEEIFEQIRIGKFNFPERPESLAKARAKVEHLDLIENLLNPAEPEALQPPFGASHRHPHLGHWYKSLLVHIKAEAQGEIPSPVHWDWRVSDGSAKGPGPLTSEDPSWVDLQAKTRKLDHHSYVVDTPFEIEMLFLVAGYGDPAYWDWQQSNYVLENENVSVDITVQGEHVDLESHGRCLVRFEGGDGPEDPHQQKIAKRPPQVIGIDPISGNPILLKDGKFGAYVTDGQTNASLKSHDSVEELSLERAAELLAQKRA